jgi:hypothetical protein
MKLSRLLLVLGLLIATFTVNAQSSRLNGQEFTIMMIDEQNNGDEIIDVFTFSNNELISRNLSEDGFAGATVSESGSNFEVTLANTTGATMTISGTTEGLTIFGDISSTQSGQTVNYVFRGMTTAEWNRITQLKEEAAGQ